MTGSYREIQDRLQKIKNNLENTLELSIGKSKRLISHLNRIIVAVEKAINEAGTLSYKEVFGPKLTFKEAEKLKQQYDRDMKEYRKLRDESWAKANKRLKLKEDEDA